MNAEWGMRNAEFDRGVVRATTRQLKTPHSPLRIPHSRGVGLGTVRIIAGEFKGRRLKTPAGDRTRPTADRVREAWLSILQQPRPAALSRLTPSAGVLSIEHGGDQPIPGDDPRRSGDPGVTFVYAP